MINFMEQGHMNPTGFEVIDFMRIVHLHIFRMKVFVILLYMHHIQSPKNPLETLIHR